MNASGKKSGLAQGSGFRVRGKGVSPEPRTQNPERRTAGFTLIEMMMGASIIAVVVVALMGAFLGQSYLNAHARNLTAAMNDATRVMEEIRRQNTGASCAGGIPSARPPQTPAAYTSWNLWLNAPAQGKSIQQPNQNQFELIAVTCQEVDDQDGDGTRNEYCGRGGATPQVGSTEWRTAIGPTTFNPIRVTIGVGWHQRSRSAGGEFTYRPASTVTVGKIEIPVPATFTVAGDINPPANGVIDSPAMLTTLVTCR